MRRGFPHRADLIELHKTLRENRDELVKILSVYKAATQEASVVRSTLTPEDIPLFVPEVHSVVSETLNIEHIPAYTVTLSGNTLSHFWNGETLSLKRRRFGFLDIFSTPEHTYTVMSTYAHPGSVTIANLLSPTQLPGSFGHELAHHVTLHSPANWSVLHPLSEGIARWTEIAVANAFEQKGFTGASLRSCKHLVQDLEYAVSCANKESCTFNTEARYALGVGAVALARERDPSILPKLVSVGPEALSRVI